MSTTIEALDLSPAEREALITLGERMTWSVTNKFFEEYRGDSGKMLAHAAALLDGARVTLAAGGLSLPPELTAPVRRMLAPCLESAREVVSDADAGCYDEETRNHDALVIEGLLNLEQRLVAVPGDPSA